MMLPRRFESLLRFRLFCLSLCYVLLLPGTLPAAQRRWPPLPVAFLTASLPASPPAKEKGKHRAGELLVRFRQDAPGEQVDALVHSRGARRKPRLRGSGRVERLEVAAGQDLEATAASLRLDSSVELVEPNFIITRSQATPDDPRFGEQWALRNEGQTGGLAGSDVGAPAAWATATGSAATTVAVLDSGIDFAHPDLRDNQWENAREKDNAKDDDRNGYEDDPRGWDWIADSGVIRDGHGHGTAVAGIIAARGNNGAGVSGVMWRAGLMSLRVLDSAGTGDVADAVEAIDYAVSMGAQVINCSWGTEGESLALRDAVERAGRAGVVVVASAGNAGRDLEVAPYYPASYELSNVISVASTDQFDNLAQFSNWGSAHVTVAAPGTDLLTTATGGGYRLVSGTSASAPLVSGVAGLVKSVRPWLSASGTRQAVVDGARRVDALRGRISSAGVASASGVLGALHSPNHQPPGNGRDPHGLQHEWLADLHLRRSGSPDDARLHRPLLRRQQLARHLRLPDDRDRRRRLSGDDEVQLRHRRCDGDEAAQQRHVRAG